ncbi:MAG: NAD(P)/FAD-dependent oxidoreductase [Parvularculaceae bacterium]|nr:NAD(P)/FAD-dependent oxidoreductase [Parvularculaceae bacterium]
MEHFDVIIVGAGISGVGAAHHLMKLCPSKSFAILEAREDMGGTWDLFRYPGIRSDSDMFTLGYGFHPWRTPKVIADGPSIKSYVNATAREYGIDRHIRFSTRVETIAFDTRTARWTVSAKTREGETRYSCAFLWMCSGYYRYSEGYTPDFPGADQFRGRIIHPQKWPENFDYSGSRVVVIGSGATAVTLIPSMTDKAAHVTMLQRSPSWFFSLPQNSNAAEGLAKILPRSLAYRLVRWWRIVFQQVMYKLMRARPEKAGERLLNLVREQLPPGYDVEKHFRPRYNPWDQRLCVVPDGDLFKAISAGKASVETDDIDAFVENGIRLKSGKTLAADIIVTATGLTLEAMGGAKASVDGRPVNLAETFTYRGFACSGLPNLAFVFGYTNSSWTLRADLISRYVCRLINFMDRQGADIATPVNDDPSLKAEPFLNLNSGYILRAADRLPKQGDRDPWRNPQSYFRDIRELRFGRIDDGVMRFSKATGLAAVEAQAPVAVAAE